MSYSRLVPLLSILFIAQPVFSAQPDEIRTDIRRSYESYAVPYHLVFYEYLEFVNDDAKVSQAEASHYVLDSLLLPHSEEGRAIANDATSVFLSTYSDINSDIRDVHFEILCADSFAKKSDQALYAAYNKAEDAAESVKEKHYDKLVQKLGPQILQPMLNFLDQMKQDLSYKVVDHMQLNAGRDHDMRPHRNMLCENYAK